MRKSIKGFLVIIIMTGLIINLNSCCTKKDCINAFELNEIQLNGFSIAETKNILISSYLKGSNYNDFIDSSSTSARTRSGNDDGDLIVFSPIDLNQNSDYIIEFKYNEETYKISNIQTNSEICNSCFLTNDFYIKLSSYKLNETEIQKSIFEIIKE